MRACFGSLYTFFLFFVCLFKKLTLNQGHIQLVKNDNKYIYDVTKNLFQINYSFILYLLDCGSCVNAGPLMRKWLQHHVRLLISLFHIEKNL